MKNMNYETFIHRVAKEFGGYLPKGLEQYNTLIKADKKGDGKKVYLTIERDKVEYIRSIELYPYYLNYLYGEQFELLLVEMVEELITPDEKKHISEKEAPHRHQISILVAGGAILCLVAGWLLTWRRKRGNRCES